MVCFSSLLSVILCLGLYSVHMLSCPPFVSLEWCLCSLCVFCILVVVYLVLKMSFFIELRYWILLCEE